MNQAAASNASWIYYGDKADAIYEAYNDPKAQRETISWISAMGEGIKQQYGDFENYEEGFIGAITGIFGAPTFGRSNNSSNQTWLGRNKLVGFSGGTVVDIRDYREGVAEADKVAENITRIMKNPELANRLHHLVAQSSFNWDKNQAIIRDDKRAYKDAETAAIFEDIMYLKRG